MVVAAAAGAPDTVAEAETAIDAVLFAPEREANLGLANRANAFWFVLNASYSILV